MAFASQAERTAAATFAAFTGTPPPTELRSVATA